MNETTNSFNILLIASEVLIPIIVFVGAYFIFRPFIKRQKELNEAEDQESHDELDD